MAKSSKWVKIAKENLSKLEEVKHPSIEESKAIFKTLEESAELCAMYAKKEYEKATGLKAVSSLNAKDKPELEISNGGKKKT